MMQETPVKVMSLLGVTMFSMFLLFAVSVSNANFNQMENPLPDVFAPGKVVAVLDNVSNSYSKFVAYNVVEPAQQSYAVYQYNLAYVIDEASPSILAYTGLSSLANADSQTVQPSLPQVAGDSTQVVISQDYPATGQGFSMDGLYSLMMIR